MKTRLRIVALVLLLLLAIRLAAPAAAALDGAFDLSWWTVDGGGAESFGSGWRLTGTLGQPEAGTAFGGGYRLEGGFWGGAAAAAQNYIYLPLAVR